MYHQPKTCIQAIKIALGWEQTMGQQSNTLKHT